MNKRILTISMLLTFSLLIVWGCNQSKETKEAEDTTSSKNDSVEQKSSQLCKAAEEANAQCPFSVGAFYQFESIKYDEKEKALVYNVEVDETYANVASMKENPEVVKRAMLAAVAPSTDMQEVIDMIKSENGSLVFQYYGNKSDSTLSITITAKELEEAQQTEVTPEDKLIEAINVTNLQMPMQVEDGLVMKSLDIIGDNVTYVYEADEARYSIDAIKANSKTVKQNMISIINDMTGIEREFIRMVSDADKNLAYLYRGNKTGKEVTIVINNVQLRSILTITE